MGDTPTGNGGCIVVRIVFPDDWGPGMRHGYQRLLANCLTELDFQASETFDMRYDELPNVELKLQKR